MVTRESVPLAISRFSATLATATLPSYTFPSQPLSLSPLPLCHSHHCHSLPSATLPSSTLIYATLSPPLPLSISSLPHTLSTTPSPPPRRCVALRRPCGRRASRCGSCPSWTTAGDARGRRCSYGRTCEGKFEKRMRSFKHTCAYEGGAVHGGGGLRGGCGVVQLRHCMTARGLLRLDNWMGEWRVVNGCKQDAELKEGRFNVARVLCANAMM